MWTPKMIKEFLTMLRDWSERCERAEKILLEDKRFEN